MLKFTSFWSLALARTSYGPLHRLERGRHALLLGVWELTAAGISGGLDPTASFCSGSFSPIQVSSRAGAIKSYVDQFQLCVCVPFGCSFELFSFLLLFQQGWQQEREPATNEDAREILVIL